MSPKCCRGLMSKRKFPLLSSASTTASVPLLTERIDWTSPASVRGECWAAARRNGGVVRPDAKGIAANDHIYVAADDHIYGFKFF